MARTTALGLAALALTASACTSGGAATPALPGPTAAPTTKPATVRPRPVAAALTGFRDCPAMLTALRKQALSEVTAYGLDSGYGYGGGFGRRVAGGPVPAGALGSAGGAAGGGTGGGAPVTAPRAAAPQAPQGFSGTNNQEAGVDEPDAVKTDGKVMVLTRGYPSVLQVLDVSGSHPSLLGKLPLALDGGATLMLTRETVIALGQRSGSRGPTTVAEVVSITDPAHPRLVRTFDVDGQLLDARFVHDRVVLVTQTAPVLPFVYPQSDTPSSRLQALQTNQRVVRGAASSDWLPAVRVTPGGTTYRAQCSQAVQPGVPSGTSTTSIVTLDPAASTPTQHRTIVGGSSVLYASESALYLATTSWKGRQRLARGSGLGVSTDLHGFGLTDPDHLSYLGSGSVAGSLTDQYSLSEDKGYLRVATTIGDPVPPTGEGVQPAVGNLSDNRVTILKPTNGVLAKVGELTGLGKGQRIFGVRFLGDLGYVVTFRTIDPLYVLDLSTPTHPTSKGELHISGYSSALYPLKDGQLLGIGQAVGSHQQQLGAQAEVFDVSVLTNPRLTGKLVYPQAMSSAQDDHHALLWWAPRKLIVLPLQSYSTGANEALVLRVGTEGTLTEIGRIHAPTIANDGRCCGTVGFTRSLVIGDLLYSLTDSGIVTNPLDKVKQQTWLPFP